MPVHDIQVDLDVLMFDAEWWNACIRPPTCPMCKGVIPEREREIDFAGVVLKPLPRRMRVPGIMGVRVPPRCRGIGSCCFFRRDVTEALELDRHGFATWDYLGEVKALRGFTIAYPYRDARVLSWGKQFPRVVCSTCGDVRTGEIPLSPVERGKLEWISREDLGTRQVFCEGNGLHLRVTEAVWTGLPKSLRSELSRDMYTLPVR